MKPLSEVDLTQFAKQERATPSYYHLPKTFPTPICSGRLEQEIETGCQVFNDFYCSITSGSENFKLKQKHEYEDNLFKNEDAMYSVDH